MSKVITLDGQIINVGEWDYKVEREEVITNPFPGPMPAPEDWDYKIQYVDVTTNPLPERAIEEDIDLAFDAQGSVRRSNDYQGLREAAYPSLADQLDALWKGGEAAGEMKERVQAIKAQYPKTP